MTHTPAEEPAPYGPPRRRRPAGPRRIRVHHLQEMKSRGERWAMLTAYDQYAAATFDEAGIPVLLVGDSASNNVYGNETSLPVTVDELIPLARAVTRSVSRALVVADLPFGSYQRSPEQAFDTSVRFMKEAGAHAVKLEGGLPMLPQVRLLTEAGIPVMAHIGFTPQAEHSLGGYRVQGRGDTADQVLEEAAALQEAGAFALVMEMVPGAVAARGHRQAGDPDHRHRRGRRLRRAGAGVAGHGRPAYGPAAPVRQDLRRPARHPAHRGTHLRRRGGRRRPSPARSTRSAEPAAATDLVTGGGEHVASIRRRGGSVAQTDVSTQYVARLGQRGAVPREVAP